MCFDELDEMINVGFHNKLLYSMVRSNPRNGKEERRRKKPVSLKNHKSETHRMACHANTCKIMHSKRADNGGSPCQNMKNHPISSFAVTRIQLVNF